MFTKIGLKNFKCFESVEIAPRLITVLIGANGTGKSSIIQALVLPKQTLQDSSGTLQTNGSILQLGDFKELIRRGGPAWVDFRYSGRIEVTGEAMPSGVEMVEFNYLARVVAGRLWQADFKVSADGILDNQHSRHDFAGSLHEGGRNRILAPDRITLRQSYTVMQLSRAFAEPLRAGGGSGTHPDVQTLDRYAEAIASAVPAAFSQVFFVPAGRGVDLPQYPMGTEAVSEFTTTRGSVEQARTLLTTLHIESHLEQQVSAWFEEALGVRVRTRARPNLQVALEITPVGALSFDNAVNQGYGYGPVVFVLAQLALAPPGSTICIEEPEIHLHPRAQAEVTAVLARSAKKESKQLILATHSEHILVKLLNLVAKGELSREDLAVYYFEKDAQTGIARAEELKVNADGTLEEGLKGFFEQDLAEIDEFLGARKKQT
ncbi:MAG: AAA family ATPase [Chloroflexi bacterium]|nr:AAA family ATPase [Chloroflexota bacterium]